eukprot:TRINITY_DN63557_c0_g1_i1.p1 TRINITY_DN63557_c0_g1~~TRINITY_DN63557_c0_g1_i1.p1  ORF type:complete len:568 (-),score=84.42 TRINITY_DN63557_c0_g1_i1:857-2560(-)
MPERTGASILFETSVGDIVIDLYTEAAPKACENILKLCKIKYFNMCPFHYVQKNFIVQTGKQRKNNGPYDNRGNPDGTSIWGLLKGPTRRYFEDELQPTKPSAKRLKHNRYGTVAMANTGPNTNASQFYITTSSHHLDALDGKHTIFGQVSEGLEVVAKINNAFLNDADEPIQDIFINHTIVLVDPIPDPPGLQRLLRDASPDLDDFADLHLTDSEAEEEDADELEEKSAALKAQRDAAILKVLGDIEDENVAPPDNVLFVCKLNPYTQDEALELIFSRFGTINSCEIIRDKKTGNSLNYGFIEFENKESCERAYLKMNNVLIDDRRIKVDFSQSVSKLWKNYAKDNTGAAYRYAVNQGIMNTMTGSGTGATLRLRKQERGPDREFLLDEQEQMKDAFSMIEKEKKDAKRKKREEIKEKENKDEDSSDEDTRRRKRPYSRQQASTFTPRHTPQVATPRPPSASSYRGGSGNQTPRGGDRHSYPPPPQRRDERRPDSYRDRERDRRPDDRDRDRDYRRPTSSRGGGDHDRHNRDNNRDRDRRDDRDRERERRRDRDDSRDTRRDHHRR